MESLENQQIQASLFLFHSPPAPLPHRRWHKRHAQVRTPYMCPYTPISLLIYVSLHYYTCVLILLHIQLPYTTIHVSSDYYIYVYMWAASRQNTLLLSDTKKQNQKKTLDPPTLEKKRQKKDKIDKKKATLLLSDASTESTDPAASSYESSPTCMEV